MKSRDVLLRYLETYATGKMPGIQRIMRPRPANSFDHLSELCRSHQLLELFLWLSNKYTPTSIEVLAAQHLKDTTIQMISSALKSSERLSLDHCYVSKDVGVRKVFARNRKDEGR